MARPPESGAGEAGSARFRPCIRCFRLIAGSLRSPCVFRPDLGRCVAKSRRVRPGQACRRVGLRRRASLGGRLGTRAPGPRRNSLRHRRFGCADRGRAGPPYPPECGGAQSRGRDAGCAGLSARCERLPDRLNCDFPSEFSLYSSSILAIQLPLSWPESPILSDVYGMART